MFRIYKDFEFCYGHRVWSQKLIGEYCEGGDTSCKCKHLHGHQGRVTVELTAPSLERGMVTDFKHLGWLKEFIDDHIDHKFIVDKNDPKIDMIVPHYDPTNLYHNMLTRNDQEIGLITSQGHQTFEEYDSELHGGFLFVDFVPTSENLCKWIFDIVSWKMEKLATVNAVEWQETPKSKARYEV